MLARAEQTFCAPAGMTASPSEQEFFELFRANAPFVWRTLRHLGVPPSDAEDLMQEVFLRVHRGLDRFEGRSLVTTWIYGICRNVVRNWRSRASHRRETTEAELPDRGADASQPEEVERSEARELLLRLLGELSETQREVFVLYEVEQLSMNEVARVVECPLQTAYARLYAARRELKRRLRQVQLAEGSP
jgi:RNA polymerase sigma-70 factor (ECF subfamily)